MPGNLRSLLTVHEGRRNVRYKDSEGYWTIGIGHLIDERKGGSLPARIAAELKARGVDIDKDEPMPDDLVDALFDIDLVEHTRSLFLHQPWVKCADEVRQAALIDMTFNMGPEPFDNDGVKDWPIFLNQMKRGEYALAAKNMLKTKWASQVGIRAARLARMVETGRWP